MHRGLQEAPTSIQRAANLLCAFAKALSSPASKPSRGSRKTPRKRTLSGVFHLRAGYYSAYVREYGTNILTPTPWVSLIIVVL